MLAELGLRAYRVSSLEKRRDFYTDHPRFDLRDVRVGELDGQIVASLVLYPLAGYVRGMRLPLTGVGSVAVAPEHRRRGIGEALMRSALREMRQRGDAFSILYAFRGSYYRKLGYGTVEIVQPLAFNPVNLSPSDEARRTRRLMLPDRPAVQALYDRVATQGHFALERSPEWWARRLWNYPGDWIVYEGRRRGQIEGYLYYEIDSTQGPFNLAMTLIEVMAATPEAHRGLVGHLASLSDQVKEIHFAAPSDNAWLALFKTAQNLRPGAEIGIVLDTGNVANGAMVRVNDVKLALETLPVSPSARGEVVLEVEDAVLLQNARAYRVSAREGRLKVRPDTPRAGVRPRLPRLKVPVDLLGPLIAGTIPPGRAAETGQIGSSGGATEIVDHWFCARPAFLHQLNAF
jgi:predicted acetyltransferase